MVTILSLAISIYYQELDIEVLIQETSISRTSISRAVYNANTINYKIVKKTKLKDKELISIECN